MGAAETLLRQRYQALCLELGDCRVKERAASKRIAEIEQEIDRLSLSLALAQEIDQKALPLEAPPKA